MVDIGDAMGNVEGGNYGNCQEEFGKGGGLMYSVRGYFYDRRDKALEYKTLLNEVVDKLAESHSSMPLHRLSSTFLTVRVFMRRW